jgi:hypothetical protein
MAKLYVFGIGGTGSRVIRSLTMLLASGVKLGNEFDTIVPLIIDPDAANGDLNRTTDILHKYQYIHKSAGENNNFFGTRISTLKELLDDNVNNIRDNFIFGMASTGNKFGDFIDYKGLSKENQAFIDLLFSEANLAADMTVGFKGNPNIGSVVLNKFARSDEYSEFSNSFNPEDGIFIINSIFGGTGASGFPLLIKNLRVNSSDVINSNIISRAIIGGLTYLPYFNISESGRDGKEIDASTFLSKSKAALNYYQHAIFENNALNSFYYLGDYSNNNFSYAEGKLDQKNPAHFLEMAGALAIVNFTYEFKNLSNTDGRTIMKEFGIINNQSQKVKFDMLGKATKDIVSEPLSKMTLFSKFLEKSLSVLLKNKGSFSKGDKGIGEKFFQDDFYNNYFSKFIAYYNEWLHELANNDIAFEPFHDNQDHKTLMDFIKDKEFKKNFTSKIGLGDAASSGNHIITDLNAIIKSRKLDEQTMISRFIKCFDEALSTQISKILN